MSSQTGRPKILGFIDEGASAWRVALTGLALGAVLTAALAMTADLLARQQVRQRFDLLASERAARIEERLLDQAQRLDSLRRFITWTPALTEEAFEGFARPLLARTQAFSWMPRVSAQERGAFEAKAGFAIHALGDTGELVPAPPAPAYSPLYFSAFVGAGSVPYGLDLGSHPARRATLDSALTNRGLAASAPLDLIGIDPPYNRGVLVVAPVYDSPVPSMAESTVRLRGFVSAIISLHELLADGLPGPSEDNLCVQILDLSHSGQHEVLYASGHAGNSPLKASRLLRLADRGYQIELSPSEVFVASNRSMVAPVIATLGTLLSLLLCALLYSLVTQRKRALRLVNQRTAELSDSEQQLRQTHGQLRNVLDAATEVAIIATDLAGLITTFNAGAERMLGYNQHQVVGRLRLSDLHLYAELLGHAAELQARLGRAVPPAQVMLLEGDGQGAPQAHHWTLLRRNGSRLTVNMLVTAVRDEQGAAIGYLAVCIDITESLRTLDALAARDRQLEKLSAEVPGGIYQFRLNTDGTCAFDYASLGLWDIYEIDLQALGQDASAVFKRIHYEDLEGVLDSINVSARELTRWQAEYRVCLPSRGERWVRGEATPEPLPDGGVLWHGYLSDISDLKHVEQELRRLSVTDSLTGAYNRRYFQERLAAELERACREPSNLALVMLDIDHFKRINDRFGHPVGDRVLQAICRIFAQRLRRNDVLCRLGGEEFVILCPGSNADQAHNLATQLWQALRSMPIEGVGTVTASFGVAGWRADDSAEALLSRADAAVYLAKQNGRDQVAER